MRPFVLHEREIQLIRDLRAIPGPQRDVLVDTTSELAKKTLPDERPARPVLKLVRK